MTMTEQRSRSALLAMVVVGTVAWSLSSIAEVFVGGSALRARSATSLTALSPSKYNVDGGYFADGASVILAGSALNRGPVSLPDPHRVGSPLPQSPYIVDMGYFADDASRLLVHACATAKEL